MKMIRAGAAAVLAIALLSGCGSSTSASPSSTSGATDGPASTATTRPPVVASSGSTGGSTGAGITASTTPTNQWGASGTTSPLAPPPAAAGALALKFVGTIVNTAGAKRQTWVDSLVSMCSPAYRGTVGLLDPATVPSQSVTGSATLLNNTPLMVASFYVPTTAGGFTVWVDSSSTPTVTNSQSGKVTGQAPGATGTASSTSGGYNPLDYQAGSPQNVAIHFVTASMTVSYKDASAAQWAKNTLPYVSTSYARQNLDPAIADASTPSLQWAQFQATRSSVSVMNAHTSASTDTPPVADGQVWLKVSYRLRNTSSGSPTQTGAQQSMNVSLIKQDGRWVVDSKTFG